MQAERERVRREAEKGRRSKPARPEADAAPRTAAPPSDDGRRARRSPAAPGGDGPSPRATPGRAAGTGESGPRWQTPNAGRPDRPTGPWDRPASPPDRGRSRRETPAAERWDAPPGPTSPTSGAAPSARDERGPAPRGRQGADLPDWYTTSPPEQDRARTGRRSGRRRDGGNPDVRWDDDLADPSELAGWRSNRPSGPPPRARAGRTSQPDLPPTWPAPNAPTPAGPGPGRQAPDLGPAGRRAPTSRQDPGGPALDRGARLDRGPGIDHSGAPDSSPSLDRFQPVGPPFDRHGSDDSALTGAMPQVGDPGFDPASSDPDDVPEQGGKGGRSRRGLRRRGSRRAERAAAATAAPDAAGSGDWTAGPTAYVDDDRGYVDHGDRDLDHRGYVDPERGFDERGFDERGYDQREYDERDYERGPRPDTAWGVPAADDLIDDERFGADPAADDRSGDHARRAPKGPKAAPGPRPELPHVAAFDGLRAVLLFAVLAFHQGFELARGGFLALSSFLTLSGFLAGTLLLAEWSQNGTLGVGRFWVHRARRILPPLVVTVAVVVVLQVVLRVGAGPGYRGDVIAALGQVLNWRYVLDDGGFARVLTDPSPVQHLWSLSLLVQLTVVLPLLFVGLMRVTKARWRAAGGAFALLAALSFAAAWFTAGRSGNDGAAYFGTHTRAGELFAGVALAYAVLSPRVRRAIASPAGANAVRFGTPAALVVLLVLWSSTGLTSANLFGGITAVNAVLTAWVVFAITMPSPVSGALASTPMRVVGGIAFAVYLVHWPVFLLLDDDRLGFSGPLLFVVRVAASLAAGAALHYGLVRPLRGLRLPAPRLAIGLAIATAVVATAAFVLPEQPPRGVSLTIDDGSGPGDLDVVVPSGDEVASIALVGGSLADSLVPGFEAWNAANPDQQVRVATHVAVDCPLSGPGPVRLAGATIGEETDCIGFGPRLPHLLEEADADVVVVVPSVGDLGDRELDRQWLHLGDQVYDVWLRQHLDDLAGVLRESGTPVVWTTSPHVRLEPTDGEDGDWTSVAANDPARVDRLNEIIRQVVSGDDDTSVLDLASWALRLPRGEFSSGQRAEGRDLTEDGATRAVTWLAPALFDLLGIEPPEEAPATDPAAVPPTDPAAVPPTDPAATDPAAPVDPNAPVDPAATDPAAAP